MVVIESVQRDFDAARSRVRDVWGEWVERHLHFARGFTLLASTRDDLAGVLSLRLSDDSALQEGFIDVLDVRPAFRRRGIGRSLVMRSATQCRELGAVSLRAWSSSEKLAVLALWRDLGFDMTLGTIRSDRTGELVAGYHVTAPLRKLLGH